jgi:hypothetical protein
MLALFKVVVGDITGLQEFEILYQADIVDIGTSYNPREVPG